MYNRQDLLFTLAQIGMLITSSYQMGVKKVVFMCALKRCQTTVRCIVTFLLLDEQASTPACASTTIPPKQVKY